MTTNSGNQISGGTFSGITTVGDNATINHSTGVEGDTTAARAAQELQAHIDRHASSLERPELAKRDAMEGTEELSRPAGEQDRDRLSDTIKRLTGRVASVGVLAEAAKKLTNLIFT